MVKHSIQSIRIIYVNLNWEYQIGNINPLINGFSFNVDAGCQVVNIVNFQDKISIHISNYDWGR